MATKILVADDDQTLLRAISRALVQAGFEVDTAANAEEAMVCVTRETYDVALVDYMLGRDNGLEVLGTLASIQPKCARAVMTSHRDLSPAETVNLGQAELVILKRGIGLVDLVGMVRNLLDEREARARKAREVIDAASLKMQEALERSLGDADGLRLVVQPIVNAEDPEGVPYAYEALLRPRPEDFAHVGLLLEAAERFERLLPLGARVFALAVDIVKNLPDDVRLFVNLHPAQLGDPKRLISDSEGLSDFASRIVFEITERSHLADHPGWEKSLESLEEAGFEVAMDDLGAGYASLSMLADLQPNYLKLDMHLVRNLHEDPRRKRLVGLLTTFGHATNSRVIAEGVESEEEAEALRSCGVRLLQGYHFGRPAPLA